MFVIGVGILVSALKVLQRKAGMLTFLALTFAFFVFSAGYLKSVLPVRFALSAFLLAIAVCAAFSSSRLPSRHRHITLFGSIAALLTSMLVLNTPVSEPGELDKLFRFLVLFPLAFIVGAVSGDSNLRSAWATAMRFWGLSFAGLAIVEFIRGQYFFPQEGVVVSLGTLSFRSMLLAEHPLVLAALILASAPFVLEISRVVPRAIALATIGGGILTTGSDGPLALFILFLFYASVTRSSVGVRKIVVRCVQIGAILSLLVLTGLGTAIRYNEAIVTSSSDSSSAQYRIVLYAFLWHTLTENPWGWWIDGIPPGVYLTPSASGVIDLSRTIDSEFVLLAVDFGWIGLVLAMGSLVLATRTTHFHTALGQSTWLITIAGFFLSIHSWAGVGTLWLFQLGMLASLSRNNVAAKFETKALRLDGGPPSENSGTSLSKFNR